MTQVSRPRFSARDLSLITTFSVLATLLVAVASPTLMVATGGIIPLPVWASFIWPIAGVFLRALVNRPLTNTFSGVIEGAVGSFVIPIGVFGLLALPLQGLVFDIVFGSRRFRATNPAAGAAAGAPATALFVFLVVYVFFQVRSPFPLVAVLAGAVAGALSGAAGSLMARRVGRMGLLPTPVLESAVQR